MKHETLRISPTERKRLERLVRLRSARAEVVQRARLILMLAVGDTYQVIEKTGYCQSLWAKV